MLCCQKGKCALLALLDESGVHVDLPVIRYLVKHGAAIPASLYVSLNINNGLRVQCQFISISRLII
jgi:hypothetical protein